MIRMGVSYRYLNERRANFLVMQAEFSVLNTELCSDGCRNGCLACLKPAAFVGAITEGLPLALATPANGDGRLAFGYWKRVAKVVIQLNGHTLIEWDHQGAMFTTTKGKVEIHRGSWQGSYNICVIVLYQPTFTQDAICIRMTGR
jgi:hypothetical protein